MAFLFGLKRSCLLKRRDNKAEPPVGTGLVFLCIIWDTAWCGRKDAGLDARRPGLLTELGH